MGQQEVDFVHLTDARDRRKARVKGHQSWISGETRLPGGRRLKREERKVLVRFNFRDEI